MLLILKVEGLEKLCLKDMEAGKEVKVKGTVSGMYFYENYISELEEKAQKYDDLIALGESISESMGYVDIDENRERAKELKAKSIKLLEEFDNLLIEAKKSDFRKVAKKGIPYKNKNYTFDGWENHIGEIINFEVFDDYLILNLEGQILHATTQDI